MMGRMGRTMKMGMGEGSCLTRGMGGQQNVGRQLPNHGNGGGDRIFGGRYLIRSMTGGGVGDRTRGRGEGGGAGEGGIGVMVWGIIITLIFISF